MVILIADGGSTKTNWALIGHGCRHTFVTSGMNPLVLCEDEVVRLLREELTPHISGLDIDSVFFYGAGCIPSVCGNMRGFLMAVTRCDDVCVESDLLGAARALCGHEQGIACILGTGSNSCKFDGSDIVQHVSPLGYVLGDEGSGAVMGRILLGNILKKQLPLPVIEDFFASYALDASAIIECVYRQPAPNKFMASFMPFVSKHIGVPEVEHMVVDEFKRFFKRNVMQYGGVDMLPVKFTGSVALHFAPQLRKAASECGLSVDSIVADPLPGLIAYHTSAFGLLLNEL